MNKKGFTIFIIIGIAVFTAIGYSAFEQKQRNPNNPFNPPPVKSDSSIDTFVEKANFPKSKGINISIDEPSQNLKVFRITYGAPHDCPSGCFYSNATGIKYKEKIGWISINDYDHINVSSLTMYNFDASDTYLYTGEFFRLLKLKDEWVYQNAFLPELAKDKDVPRNMLLKVAQSLSSYISPYLANSLLKNSTVGNDREILTVLANLPIFSGDPYIQVRAKAQELLQYSSQTTAEIVTILELRSNPAFYNGKLIKTTGIYVSAFETSALSDSTFEKNGYTYLNEPVIWVWGGIKSKRDCFNNDRATFCTVDVEGFFDYGNPTGYGHLGGYKFQIKDLSSVN